MLKDEILQFIEDNMTFFAFCGFVAFVGFHTGIILLCCEINVLGTIFTISFFYI